MIKPQFRTVGTFDAEGDLARQLVQLEGNADDAFARIADQAAPLLDATDTKASDYAAGIDELVVTDSSLASLKVSLPKATPRNAGRRVVVVRKSASNTVTVEPLEGTINGAASVAMAAAIGAVTYWSTGAAWYG